MATDRKSDNHIRKMVRAGLRHPYDRKTEIKTAPLLNAPLVSEKKLCETRGCEHRQPAICLFNTLAALVVGRIQTGPANNSDRIWRGCVYLWLTEVYPLEPVTDYVSGSQRGKPLDTKIIWRKETYSADAADVFENALEVLEETVLKKLLSPPFEQWPRSGFTVNADIQRARQWLGQEILASENDETLLGEMRAALDRAYNYFLSPVLPDADLKGWPHWPQLCSEQNVFALQNFAEQLTGGSHIFGAPGSGKTEMSRFVVSRLLDKKTVFPLPLDTRLMDITPPSAKDDLVSLSLSQWRAGASPARHWLKILRRSSLPQLPVIDNWECLRAGQASFNRELYLKRLLRRHPHFLIFSRQKRLPLNIKDLKQYEICRLDAAGIKGILAEYGARCNAGQEMETLQTIVLSPNAPPFIRQASRTIQGLLSLCRYTAQHGRPPSSAALCLRETLSCLLERETDRLGAPPSDILKLPDILQDLAWQACINADGLPRQRPLSGVSPDSARSLFQSPSQQDLFNKLLDSHFLVIKKVYGRQRIAFHTQAHQNFYAAQKLLAMGSEGDRIALQMSGEAGWLDILQYRIQLLSGEKE